MANLIHNERTKLIASALERTATAAVTVGVFGPIAAAFFKVPGFNTEVLPIVVGTGCWLFLAIVLHLESHPALKRLIDV